MNIQRISTALRIWFESMPQVINQSIKKNIINFFMIFCWSTVAFGSTPQNISHAINPQGYDNITLSGVTSYDPQQLWIFAVEHAVKHSDELSIEDIAQAIQTDDVMTIQSIKGIGAKTAQRVIIDLKDKMMLPPLWV